MSEGPMDPKGVFRLLQEDFIENVNLQTLIPKLNSKRLLTEQEEQELRIETKTEYDRIAHLTLILHRKGTDAPKDVLECLQEERSHKPHAVLAAKMHDFLQANHLNQSLRHIVPDPMYTPSHPPTIRSVQSSAPCPAYLPQVLEQPQSQGGNGQSSLRCGAVMPPTVQASHDPQQHVVGAISQLGAFSPQYQQLIVNLSAELSRKGIPFQDIVGTLEAILASEDTPHLIPASVGDFPSLCLYLHRQRKCHELDLDLLCKLLEELELEDLKQHVHGYVSSIMDTCPVQLQDYNVQPSQEYFLVFTCHNLHHMTLGQIYTIKDAISSVLRIPRHRFCFVDSQPGSTILVWQFPAEFSKHCQAEFEESSVHSTLASSDLCFSSVKLCYSNNSEPQVVFAMPRSVNGRDSPVENECVSSTTDDLMPHLPGQQQCTYPWPGTSTLVGSKRGASTSTCSTPAESPPSKLRHVIPQLDDQYTEGKDGCQPLSSRRRSLQQPEACPTASKKRALANTRQHLCHAGVGPYDSFRNTSPSQFADQYIQEPTFRTQGESYRELLWKHQPELVQWISLSELLPYLNRHELLTRPENEVLQNSAITHRDRVLKLLSFIERKGPNGCEKFLEALNDETSHLGHREVVRVLTTYTQESISGDALEESPYQTLRKALEGTYKSQHFYRRAAGPNVGKIEFIRLALVKKQRVSEDEKKTNRFLKSTLHGLVDDIEKKKESINLHAIFQYGKHPRKLVLVEGAPGVGKTMLAMKLCEDWAKGEALMEFDLVILVPLRRFQGESEITVEDLVRIYLGKGEIASQVSQELIKSGGEKVLFFLEGWDELSPNLRREFTFFFDIIMANQLSHASVMVTSRPTVTAPLYDYMDERRIEVLGFSEEQKLQYVHMHVPEKEAIVLDHLKRFPNLNALAHIPLTLAIICNVVKETDTLPPTLSKLYDRYICNTLFQNLKRQPIEEFRTLLGIGSLKDLPGEAPAIIRKLCCLALKGFQEKSFVFYVKDLENAGLNPSGSFDGYGLLSTPIESATAGHQLLYQFRHLSVQEFLAALQIQELDNDDRIPLLREYRPDKQFQNVWKFLSGITELQDEELQKSIVSGTGSANRDQLFLLHCLFEAHNTEICHVAAEKLNHTLNLNNMMLNTTDCLCTAYTVASSGGEWKIDLRGCNIGADGMEVFKWNFMECESSGLKIATFNLMHNRIDVKAASHLAEMVRANVHLGEINLGSNKMNNEGALILAEALATNETVEALHFSHCGLTHEAAEAMANTLRRNKTLKTIYFGFEPIGDRGVIELASALKQNDSMVDFSLTNTEMGIQGLQQFAETLKVNRALEVIRFDRNNLRVEECRIIADIIAHNEKLVLIDLSKNPIGDEGFSIIMDALIAKPQDSLKKVGLFGCEITSKALPKLVDLFTVTETFEGIQLGCNHLGDDGAEHIARALSQNASESVKQVLLEDTGMTQRGKDLLAEVCKSREKLDVNFLHHAQVVQKRNATNVT